MTTEQIMQWRRAEPFRPFRVRLADGRTFDVRDPYLIMPLGTAVMIGIPAPGDPEPVYERTVQLYSKDVVAVEPLEAQTAGAV